MSTLVVALDALARTSEGSKSGPIGLAVILVLCIACYFLFKSMSGHLRRVREEFPEKRPGELPTAATQPPPAVATGTSAVVTDEPGAPGKPGGA